MFNFHKDNINWGNFELRKTLYNPDYYNQQDPFANLSPDEFFNLPISEIKNRFNNHHHHLQKYHIYHNQQHSFIVNTVHSLCQKSHIPMMSVILFKTSRIGAATVPRSEIDVSVGAAKQLNHAEITALLAHEVAHSVIHIQHLHTYNEETAADIIGAQLTSESGMVHLIQYFAQHVPSRNGDNSHYSDPQRIKALKTAFHQFKQKINQIKHLNQRFQRQQNHNQRLRQQYQRQTKLKKIQALKQSLKDARRQNLQRH